LTVGRSKTPSSRRLVCCHEITIAAGQGHFLTGGSCGIGRDCAKAYIAEGALVVVIARDKDGVAEAAAELGPKHLGIVCDVTKDGQVKSAVETALNKYGRLDAVHNNAGISSPSKPIHETTDAEWNEVFDVNLKGVLHTTRHALTALIASKGAFSTRQASLAPSARKCTPPTPQPRAV